jgi:F0F1-type ATP synthase membrane subunit b/b'
MTIFQKLIVRPLVFVLSMVIVAVFFWTCLVAVFQAARAKVNNP